MLATGNGAAALVAFITLLITTAYNSLETLGIYGVFLVSVAAFSQIAAGRLEHSIIRTQSRRSVSEIKKAAFTLSLCMVSIFLLGYSILNLFQILNFESKIIITCLAILSSNWWNISITLLNYEQKYYLISLMYFSKSVILLCILGLVSIKFDNPLLMCWGYFLTDILALLIISKLGKLKIQIFYPNTKQLYLMIRVLKKNKDMICISTPNYFLNQSGRLVFIYFLQVKFGDVAVGIVTTCERYLSIFSSTVGAAISKVYTRDLTLKKKYGSTNAHFKRYFMILALTGLFLFSLSYLIINNLIAPVMESAKFKEIWIFAIMMLPGVYTKFIAVPLSLTFINLHQTVITLMFNLGLLFSVLFFLGVMHFNETPLLVFVLYYSFLISCLYSINIMLVYIVTKKFDFRSFL